MGGVEEGWGLNYRRNMKLLRLAGVCKTLLTNARLLPHTFTLPTPQGIDTKINKQNEKQIQIHF